jgi:hypothetical protein
MHKVTKRMLQAALQESAFSPNIPGPLRIVTEGSDPEYLLKRSKEMILDAISEYPKERNNSDRELILDSQITTAIALLVLAKCQIRMTHGTTNS